MFSLAGRAAFVTGAARGLGAAIARGLAEAGARVALSDVDAGVEQAAAQLRADGHEAVAIVADVRIESSLSAAFDQALGLFDAIDVMVNNAALTPATSIWDIEASAWDEVMAVNLRGSFFGCRIAGRHMRTRDFGRIINLGSFAGQAASQASGLHYAASKAGIAALTRAFAQELAPHGVTVNTLAPAAVQGALLDALDEATRARLAASIPLGRFGLAQEVAAAVVYLASDAGGFVTGATLDLNGGRSMR